MGRKKRSKKDDGGITGQEWLGTYSDTVTLLLTFFILLYTFSSVDQQKFNSISNAFQSMLNGHDGKYIFDENDKNGEIPIIGEKKDKDKEKELEDQLNSMYTNIKNFIDENNVEATVEKKSDKSGIVLRIKDNVLFELGKADVKPQSIAVLEKIDTLFKSIPNRIKVEGHTDNIPIKNFKYDSNWELSASRAINVVKYYIGTKGHNPNRFEATGYGEYHPIVDNDTNEHRAMNRRVEILIYALEKEK